MRTIFAVRAQQGGQAFDQIAAFVSVADQSFDDLAHVHFAVVGVPAVVVGDHGDRGITKLGFAGQFGFGHIGHADHVAAPAFAIHLGFSEGRKLRSLHGKVGAAIVDRDSCIGCGSETRLGQTRAGGMRNGHMGHASCSEKGFFPRKGAVDELIHDHEIPRRHMLSERSAGRNRDHVGCPQTLERVDIGTVGHRSRRMFVPPAVARQKGHFHTVERAGQNLVRGISPGGFHRNPFGPFQTVDIINARSADHRDHRLLFCAHKAAP